MGHQEIYFILKYYRAMFVRSLRFVLPVSALSSEDFWLGGGVVYESG
jgi:hypothetical protein